MSNPLLGQILGGASALTNSSLLRQAVRNWWVTAPLGIAAYVMIRQRQKKGELTAQNVIADLTPMVVFVGTLVTLNHILEQRENGMAAPNAPRAPIQAREASFTPNPPQNDVIPALPVES